jgi:hypothetical protein
VLWTELLREDPRRLEVELARAGTTRGDLARDICDVPGSKATPEMPQDVRVLLAVEWFGDEGHPQPEHRRDWVRSHAPGRTKWFKTREFGQLHRLLDPSEDLTSPGERSEAARELRDDKREPAEIPTDLVAEAVRRKAAAEREGRREGRRTIGRLPGLTEWTARQILGWYKVGKPAGLWLDEQNQLRWGRAITPVYGRERDREQRAAAVSPTPVALRLPRL